MSTSALSALDPTLLDGVREQLVDGFARGTYDAITEISVLLDLEAAARNIPADQRNLARGSQLLSAGRRELQTQLSLCVRRNFDAKILPLLNIDGRKSVRSLDALSLMADERLDEEIAVNQCTRRLKEQCEYELWGLTQRICILLVRDGFTDRDNPVFPHLFAKSLMEALAVLEMQPTTRLAVFKAFGPVLLDIVATVYRAANAYLTTHGVDIDAATYYAPNGTRAGRAFAAQPTAQEIAMGVVNSNHALVSTLKNLIERSSSRNHTDVDEAVEATSLAVPQLASVLQLPTLKRALDTAKNGAAGARALHTVRQSLHDRLNADEQVVTDIVIVMFDRLFADPRISVQLQPMIRRLQLPVLELAIRDRSLLTQVQHPVRKLIDLIAEFGLTLELSASDESTVLSVANIVDGLLQISSSEPRAFQLAFDRLDDLFYHHEEAALQRNAAVRELEHREAREFASRHAAREIAVRLQNRMLPDSVTAFIDIVWRDVLLSGYVKSGPNGEAWKLGLTTLDDLLKSLSPATQHAERAHLIMRLPPLIRLLQGARHIGPQDPSSMEGFFTELTRLHALALAGDWTALGGTRFVPSDDALSADDLAISPSAELSEMGIACGDWFETRDARGQRRWRLNWITSIRGTCVFKHYESNSTRIMSIDDLRASLASGDTERVRGLGLADQVINDAFEVVSRKARRGEVNMPTLATRSADGAVQH